MSVNRIIWGYLFSIQNYFTNRQSTSLSKDWSRVISGTAQSKFLPLPSGKWILQVLDPMLPIHAPGRHSWRAIPTSQFWNVKKINSVKVQASANGLDATTGTTTMHKLLEKDGALVMPGDHIFDEHSSKYVFWSGQQIWCSLSLVHDCLHQLHHIHRTWCCYV